MASGKVIRIGELPPLKFLVNEDLLVVNSFADDRTYSITWEDVLGSIKEISQPVFFARGSVEEPSIAFVNFRAGFYSPEEAALGITTNGVSRMTVDGEGNINIGTDCDTGAVTFWGPVDFICPTVFESNVTLDGNLGVQGDLTVSGELDFIGTTEVQIDGDLTVKGNTVLGDQSKGCSGSVEIYSNTTFYCNSYFEQDLYVKKDLDIGGLFRVNNLTVQGNTRLEGQVLVTDDITVQRTSNNSKKVFIDASAGSITATGNLTVGGILYGDGSGITNLNIPGSLKFKGAIDLTKTAPSNPQTGDLYITEDGPGTVNFSYTGITGQTFQDNQFVFYTVSNTWALGSVQDDAGFVTLSGDQTITGEKTYTEVLNAIGGINSTGAVITANNLALSGKGTSASTTINDPDSTLTTKDYVDYRSLNAVADFPLELGDYISGTTASGNSEDHYDGVKEITASIDATPNNTGNYIVARDVNGNFAASTITADLNGRARTTSKLDVTEDNSTSVTSYPLFIRGGTPTSGNIAEEEEVYTDNGISYKPNTNTLTLTRVIADVTGDVTGNTDTATALETTRKLWGQDFNGTANVSGNMSFVGDILSQGGNTKNIGATNNVWANVYATTMHGYLNGSALVADKTKESLTAGLHILSTNGVNSFNGSAATTWYVDTDSSNTGNKIVVRDPSGDFAAEIITAERFMGPLTGYVTGDISGSSATCRGNAGSATKLKTARTLWGQSFDGTANVSGSISNTGNVTPSQASQYNLGSSAKPYKTIYVDKIVGEIEGNSSSSDKVNNALTRGNYIRGGVASFDGSAAATWHINATPNNTANYIVARDGSGNFTANKITANEFIGDLTGDITGNAGGSSGTCTGNALSATRLQTTRTLWGQNFNGEDDVSGPIKNTGNIIPTQNNKADIGSTGKKYQDIYATTFHGDLNGIADIANQVKNSLFRGAFLGGGSPSYNGSQEVTWDVLATPDNKGNEIVARDASGNFKAGVITATEIVGSITGNVTGNATGSSGSCTGNAATGSKLQTPRDISIRITGGVTGQGSAKFDGSADTTVVIDTDGLIDLSTLEPLPA